MPHVEMWEGTQVHCLCFDNKKSVYTRRAVDCASTWTHGRAGSLQNRAILPCGTCLICLNEIYHSNCSWWVNGSLTVQQRLMQTPVDTQAVLLLFHPSFTLAAMQWSGQQSRHGVLTLVSRPRPQLYTAIPRHTLPEGAQARAAGVIARAGVPSTQAVPPSRGKSNAWDSCKTK